MESGLRSENTGLRSENTGLRSLVAEQRERLRHAVRGARRPAPAALPRQPRRHCRARRGAASAAAPPRRQRHQQQQHRHRQRQQRQRHWHQHHSRARRGAAAPCACRRPRARGQPESQRAGPGRNAWQSKRNAARPSKTRRCIWPAQAATLKARPSHSRPTCRRPRRGAGRPRPARRSGLYGSTMHSLA